MKTSTALVIAGAVGVAIVFYERRAASAVPPGAPPVGAPSGAPPAGTFVRPSVVPIGNLTLGLPGVKQAAGVLQPIATHLTTPLIHGLNAAVGTSGGPYGPLKSNGDGTYTDSQGYTLTPQPGGGYTRYKKNPSWYEKHIGGPISSDASVASHAVVKAFTSIF